MDVESASAALGLILSGALIPLVAMAEASLAGASRARIRQFEAEGLPQARLAERLIQDPARFLSSLMLLKTLAYVLAGLSVMGLAATQGWPFFTGVALALLAWWVLVNLQIMARAYALRRPEDTALRVAPLVGWAVIGLAPLSALLRAVGGRIRGVSGQVPAESIFFSEDGLRLLLRVHEEESVIEETEKEMIAGIVEMGQTSVREIMVPRLDVVALPADATVDQALDVILEHGHSRIPVYEENIDHIIGLLYAKDLLGYLREGKRDVPVRQLVRPAYFVPESKRLDELFREMQTRRIHMAIVVDEYGGTAGIVTIEDLLEEIVGEIQDEYDVETPEVQILPGGTYICSGRLDLDELADLLGVDFGPYHEEVDTLGGFLYTRFGRIPEPGESVEFQGWRFTVLSVDSRRIDQVRIEPLTKTQDAPHAADAKDQAPVQDGRSSNLLGNAA